MSVVIAARQHLVVSVHSHADQAEEADVPIVEPLYAAKTDVAGESVRGEGHESAKEALRVGEGRTRGFIARERVTTPTGLTSGPASRIVRDGPAVMSRAAALARRGYREVNMQELQEPSGGDTDSIDTFQPREGREEHGHVEDKETSRRALCCGELEAQAQAHQGDNCKLAERGSLERAARPTPSSIRQHRAVSS